MRKISHIKPWLNKYKDIKLQDESTFEVSVNKFLWEANKNRMNLNAISYYGNIITFKDFYNNVQQTAKALENLGVCDGDIITICSVMTPEVIYLFYACDLLGVTPNFIDPRTSPKGIKNYIAEVNSKFVVILDKVYAKLDEAIDDLDIKTILVISPADSLSSLLKFAYKIKNKDKNEYNENSIMWNDFLTIGINIDKEYNFDNYDKNRAALICHTGGTTGTPKGVMLSAKNLNALAYQASLAGFQEGLKFLDVMPPFIAYGFCCGVHLPLYAGVCTIIIPNLNPKELAKLLKKNKPQFMAGVPIHWQTLIRDKNAKKLNMSFMKLAGCGGDSINAKAEKEINEFLHSHGCKYDLKMGYGMTEVASTATNELDNDCKIGSVGYPLSHTIISIFEPGTEKELSLNEEGEICISGPTLMIGYYKNLKETNNAIHMHKDGKRWIHTGDIGYIDDDGYVFLKSRIKRVIIRHDGFKIYSTNVEDAISFHPAVKSCSVVAIKDKDHIHGNLPIAFIVLNNKFKHKTDYIRDDLFRYAKKELPEYCLPVEYIFLDEIPYTNIGKIDYQKLEKKAKKISYKR